MGHIKGAYLTRTSNEQGLERAMLQFDEMLQRLKVINGHATRNVFKRCKILSDGASMSTTSTPPPTSPKIVQPPPFPSCPMESRPSFGDIEHPRMKA